MTHCGNKGPAGAEAQALDAMKFWKGKLLGKRPTLIEYKGATPPPTALSARSD